MTRPPNPDLIKEIQEVVAAEIRQKGIEGITLRSVAGALGITPTTIYYYFKNKEDLLDTIKLSVIREMDDDILSGLNPADSCKKQLEDLARAFIAWCVAHPKLMELVFESLPPKTDLNGESMADYYRSQLKVTELVREGIRRGEFTARDPELDSSVLLGMIYGNIKLFLEKRVLPGYWDDITPLTERMMAIILATLKSREGNKGNKKE